MNWRHVLWIWRREMRDQLRDRRTLFMVAVLPVLMYPLLGTSFFQLAQFMRETTGRVALYNAEELTDAPGVPPLVEGDRFAEKLFATPEERERLIVERRPTPDAPGPDDPAAAARAAIAAEEIEVAVVFPADFAERLQSAGAAPSPDAPAPPPPAPAVLYNSGREPSQVAGLRTSDILRRWRRALVRQTLEDSGVPPAATSPFQVAQLDVADQSVREAMVWSKLLPFIVFLWALTGAFYPAIDLCAGEKERGTLETLLASPARRSEIVGGKLLTVMTFSVFTALLNLASLALTAKILVGQLAGVLGGPVGLAAPPAAAMAWIVVAVVPIAALFSALSLACAAYARSTKEGQYYFMPLFLAATPLMVLPLSPGVELNLGNSLVPVMGLVLLLRALIEGQLADAALYAGPVILVTAICCWLAMRWAVSQFNQESVLFRESERFDLRAQLAAMVRRRGDTPSPTAAIACFAAMLLAQSALRSLWPLPSEGFSGFGYFAALVIAGQVLCILAPAVLVTWLLARSWRETWRLQAPPRVADMALGLAVALALHPAGQRLALGIRELYPLSESVKAQLAGLAGLVGDAPPIGVVLLLMGVLPAVCEELAFRGVILTGLRKSLGDAGGVLLTAVLFGATHTVLVQSLAAAPVGAVLGVIALRTGSIVPCVLMHAAYNSLQLLAALNAPRIRSLTSDWGLSDAVFVEMPSGELGYALPIAILGGVAAALMVLAMGRRGRGAPQPAPAFGAAS
ncbi:ABC transporter permease subunit/CPBP intramembrane protease [Botrimarina sp.]|uniref:ABC transporter permease subunit/CPBP intramembrane protease n=1 Tax=Botrimarina sp. TaxID=2795802 RepID=UPI0032ED496D